MYEEFYGLKEKPFNLTPDPRFFFLSENHREAFEHLLYGIREKEGFILITGEVGTGKTTLCRALLNKLGSNATDSALVFNPMVSEQELLQCILSDFGVQSSATTKKELLDELNQFLLRQLTMNRNSVLIIDEAQNLALPVLEEVRILSNLETEKEKLLQIILMGQLELKDKLSLPRLRQLNQRISIRYQLQPLGRKEIPRYIQHRLMVAGSTGDIHFTSGAAQEIGRYSQGIPRLINLASDRALLAGYAEQNRKIQRRTVVKGLKSLQGEERSEPRGIMRKRLVLGLVGMLVFFVGLLAGIVFYDFEMSLFKKISRYNNSLSSTETVGQLKGAEETPFYTVHLGSFAAEAEAIEAAQRVKATGYPLFLAEDEASEGSSPHRLFLGRFADKAEAEDVAKTFKKAGGFTQVKVLLTSIRTSDKMLP
ncbi:MAG: AAA family ATPase [Candidatus Binatia bacterium]